MNTTNAMNTSPLFEASSPAAQPLVDILNAEREALGNLPPMPRPALFDSAEARAEKRARAAEIQRQREAIKAETIAKIRALAEQGNMSARAFLGYESMSDAEKEDLAAARRGRYDGGF